MRRFEFKDGSSNKFWEVTLSGNTLTVRFGRVGSQGQEKLKTFPRPEWAQKEMDKLIAEKRAKGYKEVGSVGTSQGDSPGSKSSVKSQFSGDILVELERSEPLKRVAAQLKTLQRMSLRITTAAANEASMGSNRLGGHPDLPPGISWPTGKVGGREIALPFIAQFNVDSLWRSYPVSGFLPPKGMLYFFYNMEAYDAEYLAPQNWRVIFYDGASANYVRTKPPLPIPPHLDYKARAAKLHPEVTLPHVETTYIGDPADSSAKVALTEEEWSAYSDLQYELRANKNIHQMFGHADDVQPYALENSYRSVRDAFFSDGHSFESLTRQEQDAEFLQGRLLLQVSAEKANNMQFGRGGRLFFFIREQDLKAKDFSKVWVNEQ